VGKPFLDSSWGLELEKLRDYDDHSGKNRNARVTRIDCEEGALGTRLMLHGMNQLKAKGITAVMLGVDDSNVTKAMRLYEKLGFKVARKEMVYEKTME